jgi:hypothetical protein
MKSTRGLLCAFLLFATAPILVGQVPREPHRFPVESELALLNLLVVDSAGDFVPDLARHDVTLLIDGKRRDVRFFELRDSDRPSVVSTKGARHADTRAGPVVFLLDLSGSNDLAPPFSSACRDSGRHYLIAFEPTRASRRGSSKLEVKLARSDHRPIHRPSLFMGDAAASAEDLGTAAFQFPEFLRDFPFGVSAAVGGTTLSVRVDIPTSELVFVEADARRVCVVGLYGGLFDDAGKWVDLGGEYAFAREFRLDLDEAGFASLREIETVSADASAEVEAGARYTLVLIVRQEPSGLIATYRTAIGGI